MPGLASSPAIHGAAPQGTAPLGAAPATAPAAGACLVPLHDAPEATYPLPREGSITIGRRGVNSIVCRDVAVSGVHCIVRKHSGTGACWFEVEDSSTNGTFVNDAKLEKGQTARLNHGDILALTRPNNQANIPGAPRLDAVQFRMEVGPEEPPARLSDPSILVLSSEQRTSQAVGVLSQETNAGAVEQSLKTTGEARRAPALVSMSTTAEGFAQDLLVQEQQSKAKITGELLMVRRRLDEERSKGEGLRRELRNAQSALDAERSRCSVAQGARDRLHNELEGLRRDHKEVGELETRRVELQQRFDDCEVDLGAQLQRATSLEAAQERLKADLEEARGGVKRAEAQLADVQARLQQAQERADEAQEKQMKARQDAEAAKQTYEQIQVDLSSERAGREHLEDQAALLSADAERAARGGSSVTDALKVAKEMQSELENRYHMYKTETQAARVNQKQSDCQLAAEGEKIARLRAAALNLVESTREYMEQWTRTLAAAGGVTSGGITSAAPSPLPVARFDVAEPDGGAATLRPMSPGGDLTPKLARTQPPPALDCMDVVGVGEAAFAGEAGTSDTCVNAARNSVAAAQQGGVDNADDMLDGTPVRCEQRSPATRGESPSCVANEEVQSRGAPTPRALDFEGEVCNEEPRDGATQAEVPAPVLPPALLAAPDAAAETPALGAVPEEDQAQRGIGTGATTPAGMLSFMVGSQDDSPPPPDPPPASDAQPMTLDAIGDADADAAPLMARSPPKRSTTQSVLSMPVHELSRQKRRRSGAWVA
mmetsp:Transcript_87345/g.245172  ORF Transcript_87345/g.245172 Transcript_87345/m.245172 type:complete len:773 (+) Transcript_87345:31-2349(+)